MEAVRTSKSSVVIYQSTRHHIPENNNIQRRHDLVSGGTGYGSDDQGSIIDRETGLCPVTCSVGIEGNFLTSKVIRL
jgi:hypothetical protein